jgi:uncharacterized damage-inducible protein DinB
MTNKEFFLKTLGDERQKFRVAIEALPDEKLSHKVHDRAREAGSLTAQLAWQWAGISGIITAGAPTMDAHMTTSSPKAEVLAKFDKNFDQMLADLAAVTDQEWENGDASMGPAWTDKKYMMCWGFLFDAIHHRGQLTTYLRGMGEKVPPIYGPSADSQG